MPKMETRTYRVSFTTPAFLGNAEQQAQWRTPPFKALLRQWWRVAVAKDFGYDHKRLREAEGKLFGHAWLKSDRDHHGREVAARKSSVRIRLRDGSWAEGRMSTWSGNNLTVTHPEVKFPVGAELYLGYGPLAYDRKVKTKFSVSKSSGKPVTAIQPEQETMELALGFAKDDSGSLDAAMRLAGWFGTLGSRSRNGWGSLQLDSGSIPHATELKRFSRPLAECLSCDWPHALGTDGRLLLWHTDGYGTWREAMQELARIKIAFRTHFRFTTGQNSQRVEERHVLAYPVTNHSVRAWGNQGRLANQIRFKVIKQNNKYQGLVFHLPCAVPQELAGHAHLPDQLKVWRTVHEALDGHSGLSRIQ